MKHTPLTSAARAQQEEYSNDAVTIGSLEGQTITVASLRVVTKKDGTQVLSKKTNEPMRLLVLNDGREVWPTPNVLAQLDPDDPTGTYRVRGFDSGYGNRGFALVEQ